MDLCDFFVLTDTADYLAARKALPQGTFFPTSVTGCRSWILCADDETAGASSLAFNYCCARVLKCGGDCVALFISARQLPTAAGGASASVAPLLCHGKIPAADVLQHVLVKHVTTPEQLIEVLSGVHMLPAPICAIALDGLDTIPSLRAKTFHLALALLENAAEWAAEKVPSCTSLATVRAKPQMALPPATPLVNAIPLPAQKRFMLSVPGGDFGVEYEINGVTKAFTFIKCTKE